jgi:ubiquinone/menaquinone biosynthesis C-methylase UbiE
VTDIDRSAFHLARAQQNFELRGLSGTFVHSDAEALPFGDESFDLVYSVFEIHNSPNTVKIVDEIWRVLRPGGNVIAMVYAQRSLHYWLHLFWSVGVRQGLLERMSMGKLMSQEMERNGSGEQLRVKVYTRAQLRRLFRRFEDVEILQRQGTPEERGVGLRWVDANWLARFLGWDLVVKARKPWAA